MRFQEDTAPLTLQQGDPPLQSPPKRAKRLRGSRFTVFSPLPFPPGRLDIAPNSPVLFFSSPFCKIYVRMRVCPLTCRSRPPLPLLFFFPLSSAILRSFHTLEPVGCPSCARGHPEFLPLPHTSCTPFQLWRLRGLNFEEQKNPSPLPLPPLSIWIPVEIPQGPLGVVPL